MTEKEGEEGSDRFVEKATEAHIKRSIPTDASRSSAAVPTVPEKGEGREAEAVSGWWEEAEEEEDAEAGDEAEAGVTERKRTMAKVQTAS